jgi:hypothetical protein
MDSGTRFCSHLPFSRHEKIFASASLSWKVRVKTSSGSKAIITSPSTQQRPTPFYHHTIHFFVLASSLLVMSSETTNDRKRKATEGPEPVVSSNTDESRPRDTTRPRRVSMEAPSRVSSPHIVAPTPVFRSLVAGFASVTHGTIAAPCRSAEGIGKLIQALTCSNGAVVDAALDVMYRYSKHGFGSPTWAKIAAVGGCFGLVQIAKKSLEMAIEIIPLRNQVNDSHLRVITGRLNRACIIISNMTYAYPKSRYGINSIGGVEVLVKVMKTFPKHPWLQLRACNALCNLTACPVGRRRAEKAGAIKVLLTTIKSYPDNKFIFLYGCRAIINMCETSFERTKQLIDLGGITTWPDDFEARHVAKCLLQVVATGVQRLLIAH